MNESFDADQIRRTVGWRMGMWLNGIVAGDHEWGERRMFILAVMVVAFTLMGRAVDPVDPTAVCLPTFVTNRLSSPAPAAPIEGQTPVSGKPPAGNLFFIEEQPPVEGDVVEEPPPPSICLSDMISGFPPIIGQLIVLFVSLGLSNTLRHVIPPMLAVYMAMRIGSNYIRDLFELVDSQTARDFLQPAISGNKYPNVRVTAAGFNVDENTSPLAKIGGPGYVRVASGNAAIFELHGGPSLVVGPGKHFIRQFEYLRDVIDLRDQYKMIEEIAAVTKDGIRVTIKSLEVAFRVRTSNRRRTRLDQYPFAIGAIRTLAYDRTVVWGKEDKQPSLWTETIPGAIVSIIRRYINNTRLDNLIRGDDIDPRETIKRMLQSAETRKQMNDKGVDLLWVSLGHIVIPREAHDQRINTWQAEWKNMADLEIAKSEADKLRLTEYLRALARLNLIKGITEHMAGGEELSGDMIIVHFSKAIEATSQYPKVSRKESSASAQFFRQIFDFVRSNEPVQTTEESPFDPPPPAQDVFDKESLEEIKNLGEIEDDNNDV